MAERICAEYIWIDGQLPTAKLRSKTKVIERPELSIPSQIPIWGYDGSSTGQAKGASSDCVLKPVRVISDPIRGKNHLLVLCEVWNSDDTPHKSNTRVKLVSVARKYIPFEPLFGIEQEYTLFNGDNDWPIGWPVGEKRGYPSPQGRYYSGVGFDEVHGRPLVEEHLMACLATGIPISGINAEVMPSQWEFQIGPDGPVAVGDFIWLARWLLYRLGEKHGAYAKLAPKPIEGDWNGAGAHTNFSTKYMRDAGGIFFIEHACERLKNSHQEHMKVYGADNDRRLTGRHETCSIGEFRWGIGDRGASVRIPTPVANGGSGYLEDRRPAANMDPYKVCTAVLETCCGCGFNPQKFGWAYENYSYT